jgi:choline dehydrogenase-like flavoprotein
MVADHDVIIIGTGAGGGTLARHLAAQQRVRRTLAKGA